MCLLLPENRPIAVSHIRSICNDYRASHLQNDIMQFLFKIGYKRLEFRGKHDVLIVYDCIGTLNKLQLKDRKQTCERQEIISEQVTKLDTFFDLIVHVTKRYTNIYPNGQQAQPQPPPPHGRGDSNAFHYYHYKKFEKDGYVMSLHLICA